MSEPVAQRADVATRFSSTRQPEKTGRPRESRDKLTTRFLYEFAEHFEKNGAATIDKVCKDDPSTYLKIAGALLPKEIELTRPMAGMNDDRLSDLIALLESMRQPKVIEAEVLLND